MRAGLTNALSTDAVIALPRPVYSSEPQPGTRLSNGAEMRAFNLRLADTVADVQASGGVAVVVGGDCSILLGALAGARRSGPLALIHIDGHSDFRHPGNYDPHATLGAAAGMDLALATGRGEALMTEWPGVAAPLVPDNLVLQLGERESRDEDWAWPDVAATQIDRIDVFAALALGADGVGDRLRHFLGRNAALPFWVHLDVDVLDQAVMPAVDSPGSPGIDPGDLATLLQPLIADPQLAGMTLTIFDPDGDPDGGCARLLVDLLARAFRPLETA